VTARGRFISLEEVPTASVIAEAGERLEKVSAAGDGAVARLQTPDRHQNSGIDAVACVEIAERIIMIRIIVAAAPNQRGGDVRLQIRRERAHNPAAAAGDRLGPFELNDSLVLGEVRHIGLNRGSAYALLASKRRQAQLVSVPRIHGRCVGRRRDVGLGELDRSLIRGRWGHGAQGGGR
jgi:hypothetical protein